MQRGEPIQQLAWARGCPLTESAYPAARAAAARVHPRYTERLSSNTSEPGQNAQLLPDLETIEAIIDVAFWASLQREEGYLPRVSLAFAAPVQVQDALRFERPVPLASRNLTRLGPAVERPGIHLCIWQQQGDLSIWGATRSLPVSCFVLEVVGPGMLVIKRSRGADSGKFVNIALLQGADIKVVDQDAGNAPGCPAILASLLGHQSDSAPPDSVNVLVQLATSMRAHGRGGSLLIVPAGSQSWLESVLTPITYAVSPPFRALVDLMREVGPERTHRRWQEALHRLVDGIGGLTAVDGATIMTDEYELLAFGAKIIRPSNAERVRRVLVREPIEGTVAAIAEPAQLGGTRHLSAAQFIHDQRDATALVASQDGRFTVFGWSSAERVVYASQIESLLL